MPATSPAGPFEVGDRVQLTDAKGRHYTMVLAPGGEFHTHRGVIALDTVIGLPEGSVVKSTGGDPFLAAAAAARRLRDVDAARRPGHLPQGRGPDRARGRHLPWCAGAGGRCRFRCADVLAAARGRARGAGDVLRGTRRPRRACRAQRRDVLRRAPENWHLAIADVADYAGPEVDRVVLDMLAPWEVLDGGQGPGAGRRADGLRRHRDPAVADWSRRCASSSAGPSRGPGSRMQRGWHVVGLAVRPQHTMRGHTAFLVSARKLAPGAVAPMPLRRKRQLGGSV